MKNKIGLFSMGFMQILFIVMTTWLISHNYMGWAVISQFFITFIWTFNVKKIAFSTMDERIIHAVGAMCGSAAVWAFTSLLG